MSKVSEQVLDDFYDRLAEKSEVHEQVLAGLKALFASEKKVNAGTKADGASCPLHQGREIHLRLRRRPKAPASASSARLPGPGTTFQERLSA